MRKLLSFMVIGLLSFSMFSMFAPQVKALATSNTSDPVDDLYYYQSGSPAPTWAVIDIVYAEVSQVDSENIKLLIQANQPIPLTNEWQGYYWLLDTGIPAPPYWNPIDSNDINVAYQVGVHWAATDPLAVHVSNLIDGTTIYYEDARDYPEKYFSSDTCFITIPLNWIGNPTSIKWVANSIDGVASPSGRHDKAPNSGHVTLTLPLVRTPTDKSVIFVDPFIRWFSPFEWGMFVALREDFRHAEYSFKHIRKRAVTVEWLKTGLNHGVVIFRTHGVFSGTVDIVTGERVTDRNKVKYHDDWHEGRIYPLFIEHWPFSGIYWVITPRFIEHYYASNQFPNSLVYVFGCKSLADQSLAKAFVDKGAGTYIGFPEEVTGGVADRATRRIFWNLCWQASTVKQAVDDVRGFAEVEYYGYEELKLVG